MPTREQIHAQINKLGHKYIFYTKKEIDRLPGIMTEGEEVRGLTSGFSDYRTVLAVCTNRRLILLDSGMFFGQRQWQVGLDRIQSIDGSYALLFGTITIWDGTAAKRINMVWASSVNPFTQAARRAIDEFRHLSTKEAFTGVNMSGGGHTDVASQLERLAKLKDSGHLTEEEFQTQKKKLLG